MGKHWVEQEDVMCLCAFPDWDELEKLEAEVEEKVTASAEERPAADSCCAPARVELERERA